MFENSSNINFRPQFQQEYSSLPSKIQDQVRQAVHELVEKYQGQPWNHPQVQLIEDDRFNTENWLWRLKVKTGDVNHRIFFTWDQNDNRIVLLSVLHRENAYRV